MILSATGQGGRPSREHLPGAVSLGGRDVPTPRLRVLLRGRLPLALVCVLRPTPPPDPEPEP